ncbi:hypothetical protein AVEN_195079-1 [Araneus ventricosus]|uniref:Uncharacterized protein n=1 Tax=Araneus ventricosus TaxID=182803 RepID=A0A4Y2BGU1_ARAVE|nr:hypothetical protein AVEN_195079-1 [Araneus ventricosus]
MKKRSYDVPTLLKAKPLMFFKVKKIRSVPTSDAEGIACACAIRRSCELTNQSDSTCVRSYHGIEAPVFWDSPHNFDLEPRSDDESDTRSGTPSPSFRISAAGRRLFPHV